jgi:hypothetical protein
MCAVAEVGLRVAVQIGRLTVVAQRVAPCTAPGRRGMKGVRSAVTAQPRVALYSQRSYAARV